MLNITLTKICVYEFYQLKFLLYRYQFSLFSTELIWKIRRDLVWKNNCCIRVCEGGENPHLSGYSESAWPGIYAGFEWEVSRGEWGGRWQIIEADGATYNETH